MTDLLLFVVISIFVVFIGFYAINQAFEFRRLASGWSKLVQQYFLDIIFDREVKYYPKAAPNVWVTDNFSSTQLDSRGASRVGLMEACRLYSIFGRVMFLGLGYFMVAMYGLASGGSFWIQHYLFLLSEGLNAVMAPTSQFIVALPFIFLLTWIIARLKIVCSNCVRQIGDPNASFC